MSEYPATPTLDRVNEISEESASIGAFIEWLGSRGVDLYAYHYHAERYYEVPDTDEVVSEEHEKMMGKRFQDECYGVNKDCPYKDEKWHYTSQMTLYRRWMGINNILHEYFDIDPRAEERERRAVLEYVRDAQNNG